MPHFDSKHQAATPTEGSERARIETVGFGRAVANGIRRDPTDAFGIFNGLYERDYLKRLRASERA